jgi:hypothetical protein
MEQLNESQIKSIIENAIKAYEQSLQVKKNNEDPYVIEHLSSRLYESCMNISSLIHYILKKDYEVPDDYNIVSTGLFMPPGSSGVSHTVNIVYGRIIDASIEQFNYRPKLGETFSPYNINYDYYIDFEIVEPMTEDAITEEIDAYELHKFIYQHNKNQTVKKRIIFYDTLAKIFKKS